MKNLKLLSNLKGKKSVMAISLIKGSEESKNIKSEIKSIRFEFANEIDKKKFEESLKKNYNKDNLMMCDIVNLEHLEYGESDGVLSFYCYPEFLENIKKEYEKGKKT